MSLVERQIVPPHQGIRFYMDFGFIRSSALDFTKPDKSKDQITHSYDGYNLYLLVVNEATRYVWVFCFK